MDGEEFWGKAMIVGLFGAVIVVASGGAGWVGLVCVVPMVVYAVRYW